MTRIDLYYLAKIEDGSLQLTFHATSKERDTVVANHINTIAARLGVPLNDFRTIIDLEERYERKTGKQLELLTGTATVPATHPIMQRTCAHIESAITTLDALSILSPSARAELVAALALLGKM